MPQEARSATFRMARLNCGRAEKEAAKPREARSATFRMARLNCGRAEKEAAYAVGSTECGFPNGAAELWMEKIWNYLRD